MQGVFEDHASNPHLRAWVPYVVPIVRSAVNRSHAGWTRHGRGADSRHGVATAEQVAELGRLVIPRMQKAIDAERERCARLHESVNPASDEERLIENLDVAPAPPLSSLSTVRP